MKKYPSIKRFIILSLLLLIGIVLIMFSPLIIFKSINHNETIYNEKITKVTSQSIMNYINQSVELLSLIYQPNEKSVDWNILNKINLNHNIVIRETINTTYNKISSAYGFYEKNTLGKTLFKKKLITNKPIYLSVHQSNDEHYDLSLSLEYNDIYVFLIIDKTNLTKYLKSYKDNNDNDIGIIDRNSNLILYIGEFTKKVKNLNTSIKSYKNDKGNFSNTNIYKADIGTTGLKVIYIDDESCFITNMLYLKTFMIAFLIFYILTSIGIYKYGKTKIINPINNIILDKTSQTKSMNYDYRELNNLQRYIKNLHKKILQKQHKTKRINEQYKNLLESISDYIFVMNYEKKIEMVNPSLEKFTGIPQEMILGRRIYEVFPDYYNNIIDNKINQVLASQKPGYIIDNNFFMDENKDNWFEVNIYPTNEGVLCLCTNITKLKQAETNYRLTAERYKAIVENQSELICRYSPDFTINFVNEGFCKFFNKEKEDLIGFYYPFLKDIPQEYRVQLIDKLQDINYHNPKNSIVTKAIINRKTKWIKWINKGIYDDKKQLLEYQSIGSDITQNRNMELTIRKTQQRLRRILDSIPLGVILTDPLGTILYLNRKMINFIPKDFFKNLEYKSYLKPFSIFKSVDGNTYPKNDLPIYKALSGYSSYTDDIIIVTPDNKRKNIEMWSAPILDDKDNIEYAVSTISDINTRKESEFKMKDLNKRLKESNKELAQFAYTVSHDLQQPLRGITGFSELLEEEYKNRLDRNGIEYLKYIKESSYKISQLIKSLLQYSRLDNKERNFEYADLLSILNEALLSLSIQIEESKSEIRIHNMNIPEIFVDKRLIESVFLNLISNAIKFKRDEPPFIEINGEARENEIMISVSDNGIGIKEKDFDDIFIIFQRLHDESEYPGTGLGLAMCKKIIEKHKGKIWVESEYNRGTTFYFTISKNLEHIYG